MKQIDSSIQPASLRAFEQSVVIRKTDQGRSMLDTSKVFKACEVLNLRPSLQGLKSSLLVSALLLLFLGACDSSPQPPPAPPVEEKPAEPPPPQKTFDELSYSGTLVLEAQPSLAQPAKELAVKAKPEAAAEIITDSETQPSRLTPLELTLEFRGKGHQLIHGSFQYLDHQYVLNGTRNERLLRVRVAPKKNDTDLATQVQAYRGVGLLHYKPADQGEGRGKIVGQIQLGRGDAKVFSTAQIELQPVLDGKIIKK